MNRAQVNLSYGLLLVALTASLVYRPVIAADPVPAAQEENAAAADANVQSDFEALIKEIEAKQPAVSIPSDAAGSGDTAQQLRAAKIEIGILRQAVVAALAARGEAEAKLETVWQDSRAEIDALKAAQAEDAARIDSLESALMEAKAGNLDEVADTSAGEVESAAFAPSDEDAANDVAEGAQADDMLAKVAPGSGPMEVMLNEIHFNPGSADLTPGAKRKTLEAAEKLKDLSVSKIRISGYTDTLGPAAFNKHLSLQRATSIAEMLTSLGVSKDIIVLQGNGEDGAPEPTADQVSEPLNRCAGIFALAELPASQAAQ